MMKFAIVVILLYVGGASSLRRDCPSTHERQGDVCYCKYSSIKPKQTLGGQVCTRGFVPHIVGGTCICFCRTIYLPTTTTAVTKESDKPAVMETTTAEVLETTPTDLKTTTTTPMTTTVKMIAPESYGKFDNYPFYPELKEPPPPAPKPDPSCIDENPYCERSFYVCGEYPNDHARKCDKTCETCGKPSSGIMCEQNHMILIDKIVDARKSFIISAEKKETNSEACYGAGTECAEKYDKPKCERLEEGCARLLQVPLARHHGLPNFASFNYHVVITCMQRAVEDPVGLCVDIYGATVCEGYENYCKDKLLTSNVETGQKKLAEFGECVLRFFLF
ncbi:unnamed protein product [Toxocara canis]|uniref:ShKT domain-containing protein n=1 Tax=Toxocara canis TaxID=6265 RepID=A0A183UWV7_TOXCA|nr:unnamed protein product [Toxocara canis]